jgi:hypothetical protein
VTDTEFLAEVKRECVEDSDMHRLVAMVEERDAEIDRLRKQVDVARGWFGSMRGNWPESDTAAACDAALAELDRIAGGET